MFGLFGSSAASVGRIAPREAIERHRRGEVTLVDVREPGEVQASGTASGALLIPLGQLAARAASEPGLDRNRPVVLFCASGARSQRGAELLAGMGFAEVWNLGGFGDWQAAGGAVHRR